MCVSLDSFLYLFPVKAIDRGVGFELLYSPAIKDSTMRRYTISNALNLMQVCKGKNVIISSAAERPLEIRGPYDVANLYPFLNKKSLEFSFREFGLLNFHKSFETISLSTKSFKNKLHQA